MVGRAVIEVAHLSKASPRRLFQKTNNSHPLFRDLSFFIFSGEIFGITGPNGSGKTTLLKLLCGLLRPSSGQIRVMGEPLRQNAPYPLPLGLCLSDQWSFFPTLTAKENLAFFAAWLGVPSTEVPTRVEEALSLVGLSTAPRRWAGHYSFGMRQRLALARAIVHQPGLYFLDEPMRGLDEQMASQMWEWFRTSANAGTTVVVASNDSHEIERWCDRAVVLPEGRDVVLKPPFPKPIPAVSEVGVDA